MEVKELRIGNFVYCKTENGNKVGKICALTDTMISADVLDEKDDNHYRNYVGKFSDGEVDCVMPIEITEQMLLDNGFEYVGEREFDRRRCFLRNGGDCIIVVSCTPGYTDYRMTIIKGNAEISEIPCQYLHELQNLYYEINKKEIDFKL